MLTIKHTVTDKKGETREHFFQCSDVTRKSVPATGGRRSVSVGFSEMTTKRFPKGGAIQVFTETGAEVACFDMI